VIASNGVAICAHSTAIVCWRHLGQRNLAMPDALERQCVLA